ncbi:ribonuclease H-like domain-containing protein [Tanacetum coccineum]
MAFTSSGSSSSLESEVNSCSKTYVKAYASLKEQYDNLSSNYKKSQFNLVSYKAGLESVEARLVHYKKNEIVLEDSINVLKLEVRLRDNALDVYKLNLEKAEAERDQLKQTLEKFQNSSKSLNEILECQVIDKFKKGLGYNAATAASPAVEGFVNLTDKSGTDKAYHAVSPPLTGNFIPRTFMDEIVKSENLDVTTVVTPCNDKTVENKGVSNIVEFNTVRMNNTSAPIIEDWNSDDESEIDYTVRPSTEKIKSVKAVREIDAPKQNKHHLRGNQRNWNNLMSGKLSTASAAVNTVRPVNTTNTKAVNTVRSVNTATSKPIMNHPRTKTSAFKREYSQSSRPFNRHFANKNSIININVNTARVKHATARDRAVVSKNKGKGANDVKASACWVWKAKNNSALTKFKKYSSHYYDGGFVSFGDGKGIISRKGKIKTGSLDFDDVYFCKELKYNLFSVSQIYDKKNNVLFTDTECLVLSSNFKLLDESQVLLRVPRKDNIYSVDLKSVVPTGGLTCLIAKATIDESNTWHRRLGHINFKTMNKLVKGNLVKGLPSKIFENDHSCVACQKGKQHKASYKTKLMNSISKPLHMLHMDLFGPTNVKSLMKKSYCLNGVAERKNRTLTEAARTMDHLGKFDGKADEGYFVGFLENTPNVKGNGPDWLFDVDSLTISMNYVQVAAGNKTNGITGTKDNMRPKDCEGDAGIKPIEVDENEASDKSGKHDQEARSESEKLNQIEMQTEHTNSSNGINTVSTPVSIAGPSVDTVVPSTQVNTAGPSVSTANDSEEQLFERFSPFKNAFTLPIVPNISSMDNTGIFGNSFDDEELEEED